MKKNYPYIDLMKFIFSIFIIAIHTHLTDNWYIVHLLFRLGVPFFFVTSGYFYGRKIINNKDNIDKITKDHLKRLLIPFIFFLVLSSPLFFYNNFNGYKNTIIFIIKSIFFYPWSALWYLLALIIAIYILSKFYKRNKYILPVFISIPLYLFALLGNSYYFLITNNHFIKNIMDTYIKYFISTRNGIFVGLLYVSIGVLIAKIHNTNKDIFKTKDIYISFICLLITYLVEITIVRNNMYMDDSSLYFTLPLLVSNLLIILLKPSNKNYLILRKYSICLYLIHSPVRQIFTIITKIDSGLLCFIPVLTINLILSAILLKINNKFIRTITLT